MKCGACKESHDTVAEVRACYDQTDLFGQTMEALAERGTAALSFRERMRQNAGTPPPATEKQLLFLEKLFPEKHGVPFDRAEADSMTKLEASALIDELLAMKSVTQPVEDGWPDEDLLPEGRYALDTQPGAENSVAFWKVDRPSRGRWAGHIFVKQLIGAPGDWREARTTKEQARAIADRIVKVGAREAAARFGHEAGQCGRCLSPLSLDRSRAAGYGKVCAEKLGWPW